MQSPNRKGWLAILFIVLILAIPFALAYYVSTPFHQERFNRVVRSGQNAGLPGRSEITDKQVLLLKDEKVVIDKTCIVFKSWSKKNITLELYLLELDPDSAYQLSFSKKEMHEGIRLGNHSYSLISVKQTVLRLKRQGSYFTY